VPELQGLVRIQLTRSPAELEGDGCVAVSRVAEELVGVDGSTPDEPVSGGGVEEHDGHVGSPRQEPRHEAVAGGEVLPAQHRVVVTLECVHRIPGVNVKKPFCPSSTKRPNRLECLSLTGLSSLV